MTMIRKAMALVVPALFAFGCDDTSTMTPTPDMTMVVVTPMPDMTMVAMPDMTPPPPPPAPQLGDQIERMGRPTINVAVTNPFNVPAPGTFPNHELDRDQTRNKYNTDGNVAMWIPNWKDKLAFTLAIYDGADSVCGNQAFACG